MNTTITCRTVCERLTDYVRGALSEADADAVTRHLYRCAECRAALELERGLLVLSETRMPAPEGFAASVMARRRARTEAVLEQALAVSWTVCKGAMFRAFAALLVGANHRVQGARKSVLHAVSAPLAGVRTQLVTHMQTVYRQVEAPLKGVGRAIGHSLAGGETQAL